MKPKNPLLLFAALFALLTILPGARAQQANTVLPVTFRVLELPTEFRNSASFVEWSYTSTDDTLRIGDENSGVILLGKKWYQGSNLWLPIGLNERGSLNLQLNPCRDGSQSVLWEPYNDMVGFVLVDESVLSESFTLSIYTDDTPAGGAGQKLVLSTADFVDARSVEMIAIAAPADSFGKVSGITSSLPDQYGIVVENLGGFWLGNNGLPSRGVGLNQGENRFQSSQVPPCSPMGPEFANDMGNAVVLLPRETACTEGVITIHENDLDNTPSGASWPIDLDPELCALPQVTYTVSADISTNPQFCGETKELTGHIAVQADRQPPTGNYSFALQNSTYPLQFSNEFAAGSLVTITVTTGPNLIPWSLHRDQTTITTGTLEIVGTSTGPCRPRDDDPNAGTTLYLMFISFGQPDRAGDDDPCESAKITLSWGGNTIRTYPSHSDQVLTAPRFPLNTDITLKTEGIEGQIIIDQPVMQAGVFNNTTIFRFAPEQARQLFVAHVNSVCGSIQLQTTIDP